MGKNVKALKNLYAAVGGKASDVANATTSADVINATADYLDDNPPVQKEIDDIKESISDLSDKVDGYDDTIEELSGKVEGYDTAIEGLEEDVDSVEDAVQTINDNIGYLQRAVACPISIDLVVTTSFEDISTGNCDLIKNLPYVGDNLSNSIWLNNFKAICNQHTYDIGRYIKVGLVTSYNSTQQDTSKYVSHVIDLEPTTLIKTVNGEVTTYSLFGKCQFAGEDTAHWATFEWEIEIAYNSSSDTFTETTFSGKCTSYN